VRDPFTKILGVRFYASGLEGLLDLVPGGGLIVVPSAPVMAGLAEDAAHREALEGADLAVTDSSFMVLLWLLRTGERLTRISGLRLLRGLFARGAFRGNAESFWVMPSEGDSAANLAWLRGQGFDVGGEDAYVAPMYEKRGPIADDRLLELVGSRWATGPPSCASGGRSHFFPGGNRGYRYGPTGSRSAGSYASSPRRARSPPS